MTQNEVANKWMNLSDDAFLSTQHIAKSLGMTKLRTGITQLTLAYETGHPALVAHGDMLAFLVAAARFAEAMLHRVEASK
jgi:hypothetical protein